MSILFVDSPRAQGWVRIIAQMNQSIARFLSASGYKVFCCEASSAFRALVFKRPVLVVLSEASSWRSLPRFFLLRARTSILVEHHYCGAFVDYIVACRGKSRRLFCLMLRLSYSLFGHVVAVSHGQARWMLASKLLPERKLIVIPSVSSVRALLDVPPPLFREQELVIGAIGRLVPQKGFDLLIRGIDLLAHIPCRLLLAGEGPERGRLLDLAGASSRIELIGVVEDLEQFYSSVDVVVVPSRWEPFGTVALEAKASARPVLVSDVDGLPEQAVDCGLVFSPSSEGVADAIQRFWISSDQQKCAWSRNARDQAAGAEADFFSAWQALAQAAMGIR